MNNNIKIVRQNGLDKFYTLPYYAKKCIEQVFKLYDKNNFDLIIEPSVGNGSFFYQIDFKYKLGIDILPECDNNDNVLKMDFLDYKPDNNKKNILVIGNPPFGKISSMAIHFFNHSAN